MSESYTNRQLALKLAVEAHGDHVVRKLFSVERTANQFYKYLETGEMK